MTPDVKRKVCMLGDAGVGKTSLVERMCRNKFCEDYYKTAGTKISNADFDISGNKVTLMIWDILGQRGYPALRDMYFTKAAGAMLVCDLANRSTLETLASWIDSFHESNSGAPFVVAVNKSDLGDRKTFEVEDVIKALEGHSFDVLETSARTGRGVSEAFNRLAELVGGV